MRVAICDSEAQSGEQLSRLLQARLINCSVSYSIEMYARSRDLLYAVQDGERFHAIFLNVEEAKGLDVARALQAHKFDGELVLTSSSDAFAVAGYDVGASGYLTKPYSKEALSHLIEMLNRYACVSCLTVRAQNSWFRIPYREIVYVESQNSKCIVHRVDGTAHKVYCQLKEIEAMLCEDERFLRCHQSYLVNMDHIVKTDRQFEVSGGDTVCIRQRDLRRIREQYLQYIDRFTAKV